MRSRNFCRDVREDEIIPSEECYEPVGSREINARLPFFGTHLVTD